VAKSFEKPVTSSEVRAILDIARSCVSRYVSHFGLPSTGRTSGSHGGRYLFMMSEVGRWLTGADGKGAPAYVGDGISAAKLKKMNQAYADWVIEQRRIKNDERKARQSERRGQSALPLSAPEAPSPREDGPVSVLKALIEIDKRTFQKIAACVPAGYDPELKRIGGQWLKEVRALGVEV